MKDQAFNYIEDRAFSCWLGRLRLEGVRSEDTVGRSVIRACPEAPASKRRDHRCDSQTPRDGLQSAGQ